MTMVLIPGEILGATEIRGKDQEEKEGEEGEDETSHLPQALGATTLTSSVIFAWCVGLSCDSYTIGAVLVLSATCGSRARLGHDPGTTQARLRLFLVLSYSFI